MIYSQLQERANRFKLALKIAIPFFVLIVIFILSTKFYNFNDDDLVLICCLSIAYTYYIVYLVYNDFQSSFIDPVTKTFDRTYILNIMKKWAGAYTESSVVMLKVSNIHDINERYGITYGDKIINKICKKLYKFLENKKYHKVPIGRYGGGYFLILLNEQESTLEHLFGIFQKNMQNYGIENIEIKTKYSIASINYDQNIENIINYLLNQLEYSQNQILMKPDIYDKLVYDSVKNQNFIFSYQPILHVNSKQIQIYEILVKLDVKGFGIISNNEIRTVVNRNGCEEFFDESVISAFLNIVNLIDKDVLFCLHVSPVVLRSNKFRSFILKKIKNKQINPNKFIFAFTEDRAYDELTRFNEILSAYKKMGFKFLLNHFGGNNATVEYIKWLNVDYASFDLEYTKHFNKQVHKDMLNSYINLLKTLHVTSIAKFVETSDIYESLEKMKIDMLQGYMIGKTKYVNLGDNQ